MLWLKGIAMRIAGLAFLILALIGNECLAADDKDTITAKMVCGEFSSNVSNKAPFQTFVSFHHSRGMLLGERHLEANGANTGEEIFTGVLGAQSGATLIVGRGSRDSGSAWTYEFQGNLKNGAGTLKGNLVNVVGAVGNRSCTLTF